jgi:hypothetical protein
MLTEPLILQLTQLRLNGMAQALEQQIHAVDSTTRSFEDRLGLMIQNEFTERASHRLAQRLRWAKLPQNACLEDLDTRTPRGVDPGVLAQRPAGAQRPQARPEGRLDAQGQRCRQPAAINLTALTLPAKSPTVTTVPQLLSSTGPACVKHWPAWK